MYVADTHALVYHSTGKASRFARKSRALLAEADEGRTVIYIPTPVLWEFAQRVREGSVILSMRFDHWCRKLNSTSGFVIEPLQWEDVYQASRLPFPDPFDCLIAGTALRLDMPLITRDEVITESGLVETIW